MADNTLTQLVDRLLASEARLARAERAAAEYVERVRREHARIVEWLTPEIESAYLADPPSRGKTIHTPAGSVSMRTVRGGPRVVDARAALDWARDRLPDAVVVKESVSALEIRAHVERTGEVPPGVEFTDDEDRIYVRATKRDEEEA